MNKKILLPVLAVMSIGILATVLAIGYYGFFSTTFNVQSSIIIDGDLEQDLGNVWSVGGNDEPISIIGNLVSITNNAPSKRNIIISDNSGDDISVEYIAQTVLAQKDVDFNEDIWELTDGGITVDLRYVAFGKDFKSEVINPIDEYVLVYYKDNSDRFNTPAEVIRADDLINNLPNLGDANIDENDYSEEYNGVAHGAKLWYIPEVAIINGNEVDWSMASDFLFETTLIQYNADGELIMYPEQTLDLTPVYTPAQYVSGEQSITTAIV